MDRQTIKSKIVEYVMNMNGCKMIELISDIPLCFAFQEAKIEPDEISKIIDELILSEYLIEIEFIVPNMDYRVKSFLLPAGTEIKIRDSKTLSVEHVIES